MTRYTRRSAVASLAFVLACVGGMPSAHARQGAGHVKPGITVLLADSASLIDGKRVGLLTNQSGVNEKGVSDIDLIVSRAKAHAGSGPTLTALFSPEHGIRGTEDRTNLANGRDERTGVPIYSLYGATALAPPDGQPVHVRMVFDQSVRGLSTGAALDPSQLQQLMGWVRSLGADLIRAHYPLNPEIEELVERIEAEQNEQLGNPEDLPSAETIAREFQRFLRQQGG